MRLRTSIFLLLLLTLSLSLTAQTRRIAHRSHNGSPEAFAVMLEEDHGGLSNIDFESVSEKWYLNPFIEKVRLHYQSESGKLKQDESKAQPSQGIVTDSIEFNTTRSMNRLQVNTMNLFPLDSTQNSNPFSPILKIDSTRQGPIDPDSSDGALLQPDVTPFRLAKASNSSPSQGNAGLWLLATGLILTIPTCIYWAMKKVDG